jgi:transglutaminase-like putative cysteine protease
VNRRAFLCTAAVAGWSAVCAGRGALAQIPTFDPRPGNWRTFELTTRLDLLNAAGAIRAWVPLPSVYEESWIRPQGSIWNGNARRFRTLRDERYAAKMLLVEWPAGEKAPSVEILSRFAVRDRAIDWHSRGQGSLSSAARRLYTSPTAYIPTDGIVYNTARSVCAKARTDAAKARTIYEWIVENTERNPATRGCGIGDIKAMLTTGDLRGKCADLNALFVGLCRAIGLPARDVYGIRVADSRFGYRSLGASGDVSTEQHCRTEVFLTNFGWVPADPADVRKVVQEEEPGLTLQDPLVHAVRAKLFGACEGNWLAYNYAHDLVLPGSGGPALPFLMYPQAETANGRIDCLDPQNFRYQITAQELRA